MTNNAPPSTVSQHIRLLVWFFGIILAVGSIFGALYLRNFAFLSARSYTNYLPSLHFIALNTSIVALTEAFGLAFLVNKDKGEEAQVIRLVITFISLFVFVFVVFLIYSKSVMNLSSQSLVIEWSDVTIAFSNIILAVIIVGFMKNWLNKITG